MKVVVGGTFDILHEGHKSLLLAAFKTAGKKGVVFIGLTTDEFVKKQRHISSFNQRKQTLQQFFTKKRITTPFVIQPIQDKYGPTIEGDFDAIIISPETRQTAEEINHLRRQKGKKPLSIIQIPYVLAEDSQPISSTRIRNHEIDTEGRLLPGD
jgi:pantetheine-phosphate adenylyltransferase